MTDEQTTVPDKLGLGRCLGFACSLPWPGDALTKVTLSSLVPASATANISPPFGKAVRHWARNARNGGRIERGQHFIKVVDRQALYEDATRYLDRWTLTDFLDLDHVEARARWRLDSIAELPLAVVIRVGRELDWLRSADLCELAASER
jgi:hypothetical protein